MGHDEGFDRWRERPLLGAGLQALLTVTPLAAGIGIGIVASRYVLADRIDGPVAAWVVGGVAGMLTVWALQPVVRRLVPLAWLLKLGMLWPGQAPSRFDVARRAGRVRDLEERLAEAREHGLRGHAEHAAELILSMTAALTAHDRKTRGHAERVRVFTDLLALEMGLPRHERDRLRWSALLHDIGKLEVPEKVLNKPGKPSPREWEQLRAHPVAGDRILAPLRDWLGEWADTALHHHERWDGDGYPNGLAGHEISRGGRIVAVADAYEVMTAARAYKRPMSAAAARAELVACSGEQFDPAIVRAFLLVPVWRLRWAMGPFAWVAQLPLARDVVHAGSSAAAMAPAAGAAGATAILVGASLHPAGANNPTDADVTADAIDVETEDGSAAPATTGEWAQRDRAPSSTTSSSGESGAGVPSESAAADPRAPLPPTDAEPSIGDHLPDPAEEAPSDRGERAEEAHDTEAADDAADTVVPDAPGAVSKLVEDTAAAAGKLIEDTSSAAAKLVDDTSRTAGKVIEDTSKTAGKVVEDTSKTAGKVIVDTTTAVDEAADDLTGTVGEVVDGAVDAAVGSVKGLLGK
jgi:hypothetical protein